MTLDDLGLIQACVRSEIPIDIKHVEPLLGRPEVIAYHGNRVVEPQDVAHPCDLPRRVQRQRQEDGSRFGIHMPDVKRWGEGEPAEPAPAAQAIAIAR